MSKNVIRFLPNRLEENHFHQRLRLMREVRGLSQSELARKSDLNPGAIAHFEAGRRLPSFKNLKSIVIALECDADYLLGLSGSRQEFHHESCLCPDCFKSDSP